MVIRIERLESAKPTDEGTVLHYRAAGRKGSLCIPPALIPTLLYALIDTSHRGITDDIPSPVPATAKFGITMNDESQPVLGVLFENKLGIGLEGDEDLIGALEGELAELKKRKRH